MSIDWSTVLTHFPLLDDDKERFVSWKEPDSRAKGGDASGPFRILSLANSANAEGALVPAGRVYLAGSPFINLAVFEPQAVKYDNRCEAMENRRVTGDKFQQKKRTRGHAAISFSETSTFRRCKIRKSNHRDNIPPPYFLSTSGTISSTREFSPGKVCELLMRRLQCFASDSELGE